VTESAPNPRPPVLLGCTLLVGGLLAVFVTGAVFLVFIDSGSDSGEVTLEHVAVYPPGTVTRVADRGLFIVALPGGELLALSDLDAANRAASGRRCRVAPISSSDPALARAIDEYDERLSAGAENSALVFREECNGALYDAAGVRIDRDGPNLDRFEVSVDDEERLVVDTARRTCSERSPADDLGTVECPG
jgi:hypothetical protein